MAPGSRRGGAARRATRRRSRRSASSRSCSSRSCRWSTSGCGGPGSPRAPRTSATWTRCSLAIEAFRALLPLVEQAAPRPGAPDPRRALAAAAGVRADRRRARPEARRRPRPGGRSGPGGRPGRPECARCRHRRRRPAARGRPGGRSRRAPRAEPPRNRASPDRPSAAAGSGSPASSASACATAGDGVACSADVPPHPPLDSRRLCRVTARPGWRPFPFGCAWARPLELELPRRTFLSSFLTDHGVLVALVCAACAVVYGVVTSRRCWRCRPATSGCGDLGRRPGGRRRLPEPPVPTIAGVGVVLFIVLIPLQNIRSRSASLIGGLLSAAAATSA